MVMNQKVRSMSVIHSMEYGYMLAINYIDGTALMLPMCREELEHLRKAVKDALLHQMGVGGVHKIVEAQ